jgi:hypothetical protein
MQVIPDQGNIVKRQDEHDSFDGFKFDFRLDSFECYLFVPNRQIVFEGSVLPNLKIKLKHLFFNAAVVRPLQDEVNKKLFPTPELLVNLYLREFSVSDYMQPELIKVTTIDKNKA